MSGLGQPLVAVLPELEHVSEVLDDLLEKLLGVFHVDSILPEVPICG